MDRYMYLDVPTKPASGERAAAAGERTQGNFQSALKFLFFVPGGGGGSSPVGLALFTAVDYNTTINDTFLGATAHRSSLSWRASELSWG